MAYRFVALTGMWFALLVSSPSLTQENEEKTTSLAELARQVDLIAVVRVEATEYEKTRSFPSKGHANLRVLIAYKGIKHNELVVVSEEGLDPDACYYPEVGPFEREGQRFLVFLKKTPKNDYRGRAPGCRMPVLVTNESRYALLYPIPGLSGIDPAVVKQLTYSDPAAFTDATESTVAQKAKLTDFYQARLTEVDSMEPGREIYVYTRGVPIERIRAMMFPAAKQ